MKKTFSLFAVLCVAVTGYCQQVITFSKEAGITPLSSAPILVDAADFPLVNRSAELLAEDFERVTSVKKALSSGVASANTVIIIGSLTNSSIIQKTRRRKENQSRRDKRKMGGLSHSACIKSNAGHKAGACDCRQ